MEIVLFGDPVTVQGFRLAGLRHASTPPDAEELSRLLREACRQPEIGLVLITERLAETVREVIAEIRSEKPQLIILEIPGPEGPIEREVSPIIELLQRTLGAKVKM